MYRFHTDYFEPYLPEKKRRHAGEHYRHFDTSTRYYKVRTVGHWTQLWLTANPPGFNGPDAVAKVTGRGKKMATIYRDGKAIATGTGRSRAKAVQAAIDTLTEVAA